MASLKTPTVTPQLTVALALIASINLHAETADSPKLVWATQLGNRKNCNGSAIALDETGNAYVTGMYGNKTYEFIGTHGWHSSGGEVFLTKLNPDGKITWQKFFGGDGIDGGNAVAAFGNDVVYVAGSFSKTIHFGKTKFTAATSKETRGYSFPDGFVARFDANGNPVWLRQFGGPALDEARGIACDKLGNVYVAGDFQGKATFGTRQLESKSQPRRNRDPDERDWHYGDLFVAKYDPQGNLVWVRQAGESGLNAAYALCVDGGGNVYVSGVAESGRITLGSVTLGDASPNERQPCFLAKYDADGNVLWAQSVAGNDYYHRFDNIAVDTYSNLFVGGQFSFTQRVGTLTVDASMGRVFVAKYRPDGTLLWCKQGGSKTPDSSHTMAVDSDGRCFIAGTFDESATFGSARIHAAPHSKGISGYEPFVIGYSGEGAVVSAQTLHRNAGIQAMAAGADGSLWLMGGFYLPVEFGTNKFKTRTEFREHPDTIGETVSDTFVARYQMKQP